MKTPLDQPPCPHCGFPLRIYGTGPVSPSPRPETTVADGLLYAVLVDLPVNILITVVLLIAATTLTDAWLLPAAALALVIILGWGVARYRAGANSRADRAQWYCEHCHAHYEGRGEGNALRESAPPLSDA